MSEPESEGSSRDYCNVELTLRVILISQQALSWGQVACVLCMFLNSCKKIEEGKNELILYPRWHPVTPGTLSLKCLLLELTIQSAHI